MRMSYTVSTLGRSSLRALSAYGSEEHTVKNWQCFRTVAGSMRWGSAPRAGSNHVCNLRSREVGALLTRPQGDRASDESYSGVESVLDSIQPAAA
jgi:hypothetical protein